jgi:SAM-dependent methyltransferase
MHLAVLEFFTRVFPIEEQLGKSVLEVGSRFYNGTLRQVILLQKSYLGVDMEDGPLVDVVCNFEDFIGERQFDYVVSASTLEHCKHWQAVIDNMKRLTQPEGHIILACEGPGKEYHGYPKDYWRFSRVDMRKIFADWFIVELAGAGSDTFIKAKKPHSWRPLSVDKIKVMAAPSSPEAAGSHE